MHARTTNLVLILALFNTACATPYKLINQGEGWVITSGSKRLLPEFTIDLKKKYPTDFSLASNRFERRRGAVQAWYKKYHPDYLSHPVADKAKIVPAVIFGLLLAPIIIPLMAYEEHRYHKRHDAMTEEEKRRNYEKFIEKQKIQRQEIYSFIGQDLREEEK